MCPIVAARREDILEIFCHYKKSCEICLLVHGISGAPLSDKTEIGYWFVISVLKENQSI